MLDGVLHERGVHVLGADALGGERLGAGQLLVDGLLEEIDGLRALDAAAVDEEGRGPGDAQRGGEGLVAPQRGLGGGAVALPARHVEAGLAGEPDEALLVERARAAEEALVHRPELPLCVGGDGGQRRRAGVRVDGQRVLAHHGAELGPIGLAELRHQRVGAATEGALVVREAHQRHRRAGVAQHRRAVDGDAVHGGPGEVPSLGGGDVVTAVGGAIAGAGEGHQE